MALLALVRIRNEISEVVFLSSGVGVTDRHGVRYQLKAGVGLLFVPDVRKSYPTGAGMHQESSFNQPLFVRATALGEGETLDQHCSYRKVEYLVCSIFCRRSLRHPDKTVLCRVVGKQRRVQVVRQNAFVRAKRTSAAGEEIPFGEFFGKRLADERSN